MFVNRNKVILLSQTFRTSSGKMAAEKVRSEDIPGEKWDRCLSDTAIKVGKWKSVDDFRYLRVIRMSAFDKYIRKVDVIHVMTNVGYSGNGRSRFRCRYFER